ncbi:PQQ-dependent sugar dehydrogenase [Actinokineospora globicatena]|uniref:PQQ-dependent sugar dehydrogenase n=1 Tax=Actinokineospora globicatena TaxID=103729 RepID=UPI0024A390A8|nr:Glucose/arabinose dehydrogenase, beta-propeller fold [Actinokineospora globicatena]GLW81362.1 glucose dehydrogenase [Actinokineospora globicatena]GLW87940.1 glucose dehydrogenase [Actinokineospora globicatena]
MAGVLRTPFRLLTAMCVALAVSSCATFADQPPEESWQANAPLTPQAAPEPETGGRSGAIEDPQAEGQATKVPPPDGCKDFHPAVLATCLDTVVAVAALPGDGSNPTSLVAERKTGRILLVRKDNEPTVFATVAVDASTDGGLTGLALSPTYEEDQLVFAYITTPTDNRVVRIAPGDKAKPVLTGIPRGATGNRGSLARDHRGALVLATGDAGSATAAADPKSLAGKVLRITGDGRPAPGNPTSGSAVLAAGLHAPGGICASLDGTQTWVTDRTAAADVLYRVTPGKALTSPAWSWPDKPGVAGCAATPELVWVAMATAGHLENLPQAPDGTFTGKPQIALAAPDGFGKVDGLDLMTDQIAIAGTVNRQTGPTVSSDDRVVAILVQPQGGGGGAD